MFGIRLLLPKLFNLTSPDHLFGDFLLLHNFTETLKKNHQPLMWVFANIADPDSFYFRLPDPDPAL